MKTELGNQLKRRRGALGVSQAQVASLSGSAQATVSLLERDRLDARVSTLIDIARALGMDVRLIPREVIPAVDDLIGAVRRGNESGEGNKPLYSLDDDDAAAD
jgi:HTH-type transcriptional regulator/antitoxin HipB